MKRIYHQVIVVIHGSMIKLRHEKVIYFLSWPKILFLDLTLREIYIYQ